MALSPNYGFPEPDNSSLVKNGAQDIRALGDAVDTAVWNVGFGQAGKNKIINANFSVNQRAFTTTTTNGSYGFDRWRYVYVSGTTTYSAQTFTLGAAPVAGYESANFARVETTGQTGNNAIALLTQRIESVRTLAGQPVTVSFWAKAASGTPKIGIELGQFFGTGGSATVSTALGAVTISTGWVRYSATVTLPSISGKTIAGGNDYLNATLWVSSGSDNAAFASSIGIQNNTFDIWGVQVEYGSKATPFQLAGGGDAQSELAMCQRYYYRFTGNTGGFAIASMGNDANTITTGQAHLKFPVTMRSVPQTLDTAGTWYMSQYAGSSIVTTALAWNSSTSQDVGAIAVTVAAGLVVTTKYQFLANNSTASFVGFSAEL
jgi:hypothetical protein